MIDSVIIKKDNRVWKQIGKNNDIGWCLSTDPTDASRTWKGHAVGDTCKVKYEWTL